MHVTRRLKTLRRGDIRHYWRNLEYFLPEAGYAERVGVSVQRALGSYRQGIVEFSDGEMERQEP